MNNNKFNFGKQDDGTDVKEVILPRWAKSPEDFVRINRMVNIVFMRHLTHSTPMQLTRTGP